MYLITYNHEQFNVGKPMLAVIYNFEILYPYMIIINIEFNGKLVYFCNLNFNVIQKRKYVVWCTYTYLLNILVYLY